MPSLESTTESMTLKKQILLSSLVAFLFLTSACASVSKSTASDMPAASLASTSGAVPPIERKIVRQASLDVEVKDVASSVRKVTELVQSSGGYVENSLLNEARDGDLDIRVPAAKLDATLDAIAALGEEQRRRVNAVDKTLEYIDLEAKIKNTTSYRDQLRVLLTRAKDMKDILQIQETLNRTQAELDSLEGVMKQLKGDITLSKVNVSLQRERVLGPLGYVIAGAAWVVGKLFIIQ